MALSSPWSRSMVERLAALGVEVHVVDFERRGPSREYLDSSAAAQAAYAKGLSDHVAAVHRVPTSRFIFPRLATAAANLRRIARDSNADIVLTLYGGAFAAMAWLSGVRPYVVYVVGSDVLLARGLEKKLARVTLRSAAIVLANGVHLADRTAQLAPKARIRPLYIGTDLEAFRPVERTSGRTSFICTRGFLPIYDNITIVHALALLGDDLTRVLVTFLSSGPLLPQAIAAADELLPAGARDAVVFQGGASEAELMTGLSAASFYVSASLSDGTSTSLLEALAAGLFPILSDIPANREWVTHGKNGLLFQPRDPQSLADCIRTALRDEPWMEEARVTNRHLVEERASATTNMATLAAVLASCSTNNGTPVAESGRDHAC